MRALLFLILLALSAPAHAVNPDEVLADPALEARARHISASLRCMVCRNESIDDSNADLAHDLRIIVRERLQKGDTDGQVIQYMRSRYGDFVLLKPPVEPATWLLWYGPPLLFAGLIATALVVARHRPSVARPPLSDADRQRAAGILSELPSPPFRGRGRDPRSGRVRWAPPAAPSPPHLTPPLSPPTGRRGSRWWAVPDMLLWIVLAVFTALVMAVLLRPLARPAVAIDDNDPVAVLRDQLRELDRDREAGLLPASEAEAARLEIERRALAFSAPAVEEPSKPRSFVPIAIVLVSVPGIALALYLALGSPDASDQPLAARGGERELLASDGSLDLAKARAALLDRLAKDPNSLEGWMFLARTDAALGRPADVKHDFEEALRLSQRDVGVLESYGEAVVGLAGGTVTPEAAALFKEAAERDPHAYGARFDLGLERAQNGDMAGAIEDWRKIEQEAPPDAPWLGQIRDAIVQAQKEAASPGAQVPTGMPPGAEAIAGLPPGQRLEAIKGMVAGLAARLEQQPNDLDGWRKLARSYAVLGQTDQAEAAYRKALALAPDDPDLKSQLAALTARGAASSAPAAAGQ